jgi:hypothetical protein
MRLGRELFSACGRDVDVTFRACERRTRAFIIASALVLLFAGPVIAANGLSQARATVAAAASAPEPALPAAGGLLPDLNPPAAPSTGLARAAVAAAEGAAGGSTELAVAVLDRETGEVALGARASEPYYTASLSKVVVAVDALDRRRLEGLVVTDPDIDLLRQAIGPSDDGAMNALWSRFDGAGAAGRVSSRLRLPGPTAPLDPSQWGEMSMPAGDSVLIWQHIVEEMPAADRDLLLSAMDAAPPTAADGFPQTFGLLAPAVDGPGGPGAVAKQGWMCCFSGKYYMHSTGTVGPDHRFIVALLTRLPRAPGWEAARQELTRIATAAVQAVA